MLSKQLKGSQNNKKFGQKKGDLQISLNIHTVTEIFVVCFFNLGMVYLCD